MVETTQSAQPKRKVKLPDATNLNLDQYMKALYDMDPKDLQSLGTAQWNQIFKVIVHYINTKKPECAKIIIECNERQLRELKEQKEGLSLGVDVCSLENNLKQLKITVSAIEQIKKEITEEQDKQKISANQSRLQAKEKDKAEITMKIKALCGEDLKYAITLHEDLKKVDEDISKLQKKIRDYWAKVRKGETVTFLSDLISVYPEVFIKLYSNYRFSEDIIAYLDKMGKAIGQRLAEIKPMTSSIALNIQGQREQAGNQISKEMLELLFYGAEASGVTPSPVTIVKGLPSNGSSSGNGIELTDIVYKDTLETIVHECLHEYGQPQSDGFASDMRGKGVYAFDDSITTTPEIDAFMYILYANAYLYVTKNKVKSPDVRVVLKAYRKQPMERYSNYVSTVAMREYRRLTGYQRPNNAVDLYKYLNPKIGEAYQCSTNYETKENTLYFKASDTLNAQTIKDALILTDIKTGAKDVTLLNLLNIKEEIVDNVPSITITIPENWDTRSKVLQFVKTKQKQEAMANFVVKQKSKSK